MKTWKLAAAAVTAAALVSAGFAMTKGHVKSVQAAAGAAEEEASQEEAPSQELPSIDTRIRVRPGSRIAVVSKQTKGDFWVQIREGMENAVKDVNTAYGFSGDDKVTMTFEGPKDERDIETQINTLDAVIAENPDVLCLCAGDMDSCLAQLEAAEENGIPVVVFDSTVAEDDLISAYRGTDNLGMGRIAAEKISESVGDQGKILVFSATEKSATVRSRVAGFLEELSMHPGLTLIDVIYQDQVEDFETAMQEALQTNPDTAAVYCTNGDTTDLFLQTDIAKELQETLIVVGTDGTKQQIKAIEDGRILGCVSQKAWQIGYDTILAAAQLSTTVNLTRVERDVYLEPMWIDADNAGLPETQSYIYD